MSDEHHGELALGLEPTQQLDDRRLDRDIQRRCDLVTDENVRIDNQASGDRDALALPAGELVRVAPKEVRGERDIVEDSTYPTLPFRHS